MLLLRRSLYPARDIRFGDLPHVEGFVRAFYDKLFFVEGYIFKIARWLGLRFAPSLLSASMTPSVNLKDTQLWTCPGTFLKSWQKLLPQLLGWASGLISWTKSWVRLRWKRKHVDLLERTQALEEKLYELDRQRDEITQTLAEIDAEIVANNFSVEKVVDYPVRVLRNELLQSSCNL